MEIENSNSSINDEKDINSFKDELRKVYTYSSQEFDKNILFISTGALGISFAFIEKFVILNKANCKNLLFLGWLFLTASIITYLISHINSKKQVDTFYISLEKCINKKITIEDLRKIRKKLNRNIDLINIISIAFLIFGILFILKFIWTNL